VGTGGDAAQSARPADQPRGNSVSSARPAVAPIYGDEAHTSQTRRNWPENGASAGPLCLAGN
jgi:hypothetical protein